MINLKCGIKNGFPQYIKGFHVMFYGAKILFAGIVAIGILSVFVFFYDYSGIHIKNLSGATDYTWEANQRKATMTEGFAFIKMDGNGYNNKTTIEPIDMLLMGSSHMEAINVSQENNVGYLLNENISDGNVYNIGMSGHTIYHCVNNMSSAVKQYSPTQYVLLETDKVKLDLQNMQDVLSGEFKHIPSYDTGILYWIQKNIPAIKCIYKSVDDWKNAVACDKDYIEDVNMPIEDAYYDVLCKFLKKASADAECQLVIFYQPNTRIDEFGNFVENNDEEYLQMFSSACQEAGIQFIDMTSDFKKLYEDNHILAHGFANTFVGTGHLNEFGHKVIAERLLQEVELKGE